MSDKPETSAVVAELAELINEQRAEIDRLHDKIAELSEQPTLHDRYVMAAITGFLANPNSNIDTVAAKYFLEDALCIANAAMEARK